MSLRFPLRRAARAIHGRLFRPGLVMHGPSRPEVALTFDDGPTPDITNAILDILAARKARATFFMLGSHIEANPDLARRVGAEQEIGCHSYAHRREAVERLETFSEDTERALLAFDRHVGRRPGFYRFPWGNPGRVASLDVERLFGMKCVHWSGGGGEEHGEEIIVQRAKRALEPGAILLLHDGLAPNSVYPVPRDATVASLPRILDAIEAQGLKAVSLRQLLEG